MTYSDSVFRCGFDAYERGELQYANPYDKHTIEYDLWLQGWRTADLYDFLESADEMMYEDLQ